MKKFADFTINNRASCLDALRKLDKDVSNQTLFVLDEKERLFGTVTDGDIRRGLIRGLTLESCVSLFCNKSFSYINNEIDVAEVSRLKAEGIKMLPKLSKTGHLEKIYDLSKVKSIIPVHAVIMAGGRGERLRPLTDKTPKSMLKLGNKPIIEHTIDHLITYGIERMTISIQYLSEQISDYLGNGSSKGIKIDYLKEKDPMGTIGCLSMLTKTDFNTLLVINSDLFTNINYEDLFLTFKNSNADMAVASIPYSVDIPYAILNLSNDKIINYKEKPRNTYYANAGIYMLKKKVAEYIPYKTFFNATDLMDLIIKKKGNLIQSPITGFWIDIGKMDDYNKAKEIYRHL